MSSNIRYSALVLLLALQASLFAKDAIHWAPDLDTARRIAAEKNMLVYVHFQGNNCPPCRRLEANVFSQPSFAQSLEKNFVPVNINGSQNPEVAKQFHVDRWPQDVIITPSGKFVYRSLSPQDQGRYESMLAMVAAKANPQPASPGGPSPTMVAQAANTTTVAPSQPLPSQTSPQQPAPQQTAMTGPSPSGSRYSSYSSNPAPSQTSGYGPSAPQQGVAPTSRFASNDSVPTVSPMGPASSPQSRFTSNGPASQSPSSQSPSPQSQVSPARPATPQSSYAMQPTQPAPRSSFTSQQPEASAPTQPAPSQPAPPQQSLAQQAPPQQAPPQQAPSQQPAAAPANEPKFAMDGYCPVTLLEEWKWQKGDPRWGANHQGQIYLFSSQAEQQKFLANPNQYSPVMSGIDPVAYLSKGQVIKGDRRFGMTFRGSVYLFSSEENLQAFYNDSQRYSTMIQQAMASRNMQR